MNIASGPAPAPHIPGLTFVKVLGSGGYADVYLYQEHTPRRKVAVKIMRGGVGADHRRVEQFMAEANAMAQLEHPNIVPVFAVGSTADDRPYIAMSFYPGGTLADRIATSRVAVSEALSVGIQVGCAVATAHQAGLLHRDIKPHNILVNQYGSPGLSDFGIVGALSDPDDDDLGVSVPWTSPEVLYATASPSISSDLYSLGATLWHLLSGQTPFHSHNDNGEFAMMQRIRDQLPPAMQRVDLPRSLERLLRDSLAKDPAVRPANAVEFVKSLQRVEQDLRLSPTPAVVAVAEPITEPISRTVVRSRPERSARGDAIVPRTRMKLTTVSPDPSVPVTALAHFADPGRPGARTQQRSGAGDIAAAATQHRADKIAPAQTPAAGTPRSSRRPLLVVGSLVVVVVLAAAGGWRIATADGPGVDVPDPSPTTSVGDPGSRTDELPPGPVSISWKRLGNDVVFSWGYSAALSSDTFQWRVDEGRVHTSDQPTARVSGSGRPCLQVKVVRLSGGQASREWSEPACAR